jgi:hypothetical protein
LYSFSKKKPFVQYFALIFLFSEQTTQVQHLVDDQIPTQKRQFFLSVKRRNGYVACFDEDKRAAASSSSSSSFEETWVVETAAWLAFSTKFAFCQAPRERERERERITPTQFCETRLLLQHISSTS